MNAVEPSQPSNRPAGAVIETARLRLRELQARDIPELTALLTDPVVMQHYPALQTNEFAAGWYAGVRALYETAGYGPWTLELQDGTFVGQCGPLPHALEGRLEIEIICFMRRPFWRSGYSEEACRACIDYAFERLGVRRIVAFVLPQNRASSRLALRCGLTYERSTERNGAVMALYARENRAGP